jgi:hypothetical protein
MKKTKSLRPLALSFLSSLARLVSRSPVPWLEIARRLVEIGPATRHKSTALALEVAGPRQHPKMDYPVGGSAEAAMRGSTWETRTVRRWRR